MANKKIAVISPNITNLGGISRCVVVLIEALNKRGIVPDYYGIDSDVKKVYELFNRKIKYNFKKIFWFKRFIAYSSIIKNFQLMFKKYDYIFDFTNMLPFARNGGRYFSYILYPEFMTKRGKYNKKFWRLYYLPKQIIAYLCKNKFKKGDIDIACVSKEVSDILYKKFKKRYPVLYPPANIKDFKNNIKKKIGIVSVGGLTDEKNQLEQIEIAKCFPKIKFSICGNAKRNPLYYKKLVRATEKVKNVEILPNLPFNQLKEKVTHSEIFLNSGRNDPFCMALVEGIAAGCIPLIHNSGGITEIVPFKEFRYDTKKEAIQKLKKILEMGEREKNIYRKKLQKHIQKFGERQFVNTLFSYMEGNKDNFFK